MILEFKKDIKRRIRRAKTIFIVAHKELDLDAIGSTMGIYELLTTMKKRCYIVIDDITNELGVEKVLNEIKDKIPIITSNEINNYRQRKSLLIITDTNKKYLLQNPDLNSLFEEKIIIDHHEITEDTIKDGLLIIDTKTSSTCEMITELLYGCKVCPSPFIATILLSGIVLDTNNFVLKTRAETYYTAYYLTSLGADPKKVQYLLKQDINDYIARQKVITNLVVIKDSIAIAKGETNIKYRREELAKIADTLLFFNDMEASFVIGKLNTNEIGISARSLGKFKIQPILEMFGGGGGQNEGAAKITDITISKVEKEIIKYINEIEMEEEK